METKKCCTCGEEKPLDQFPLGRRNIDGRHSYCKKCDAARSRKYYQDHKDERKAYDQTPERKKFHKDWARNYYLENKEAINKRMRSRPTIRYNLLNDIGLLTDCVICGYPKIKFAAIQFHHINPSEKIQTIGIMAPRFKKYPDDIFIKEAKKCICMCANCHMLYHAGDIEIVKKYNKFLGTKEDISK